MRFSDIIGHQELKQSLINSVKNDHLAHAQLFHGPEGGASLAMALALISYINCEDKGESDSCGVCASCVKLDKLIHPDIQFIFPSAATDKVKSTDYKSSEFLEQWRSLAIVHPYFNYNDWMKHLDVENKQGLITVRDGLAIIKKMSLKSFEAEYKATIIWMPETMHNSCANSLLKILEEPPEKSLFILVTYDYEKLLPTIISRTQQVYVPQFSDQEIREYFQVNNISGNNMDQVVRLSEGNLNLAIKLNSESDNNLFAFFTKWLRVCYDKSHPSKIIEMADEFQKFGREGQKNLFIYGLKLLRNVMLENSELDNLVKLQTDEQKFIKDISKLLTYDKLADIIDVLNDTHYYISRNAHPKIIFTSQSLEITRIFWQKEKQNAH